MDSNIMNASARRLDANVMMDYEFDIGWNVEKDGYKCYDCLTDLLIVELAELGRNHISLVLLSVPQLQLSLMHL